MNAGQLADRPNLISAAAAAVACTAGVGANLLPLRSSGGGVTLPGATGPSATSTAPPPQPAPQRSGSFLLSGPQPATVLHIFHCTLILKSQPGTGGGRDSAPTNGNRPAVTSPNTGQPRTSTHQGRFAGLLPRHHGV